MEPVANSLVSFHSRFSSIMNSLVNFMDVPKNLIDCENLGVLPNSMVMVNTTLVKMNTLAIVLQTAHLKMIVSGILGVLGLTVLNHVGLE